MNTLTVGDIRKGDSVRPQKNGRRSRFLLEVVRVNRASVTVFNVQTVDHSTGEKLPRTTACIPFENIAEIQKR